MSLYCDQPVSPQPGNTWKNIIIIIIIIIIFASNAKLFYKR